MRLLLVGDVMLGRGVNAVLRREPPSYPWGDTLPLFLGADLRILNLECVIADGGRPWSDPPKTYHFRSAAKNVATLAAAGVDAVSLANNHTLDYEHEALSEMLSALDAGRIAHAGAGADAREARRPAVVEAAGTRVGLVAFSDNEPEWAATTERGGIYHVPADLADARVQDLLSLVRATRASVDLLVVSAHWGPNWGHQPPPEHVALGRALVEAGADVVFGHSAHVFRGVEVHRGRAILYCAGDFVDDYAVDPVERNDESFAFLVETEGARCTRLFMVPTVIRDCQARLATGRAREAIADKMKRLCEPFSTRVAWRGEEGDLEVAIA